eukprot:TRINITY_DN2642_c0_g1_i1.p1 TRINITY_DN2642_c0_g1~~TRINITY_DN2642_c0_g1_i1.p1  ORF type:complete len:630 (+),score=69.33 TRINITY_DN2642_c0_g1_i1:184-1890(+)
MPKLVEWTYTHFGNELPQQLIRTPSVPAKTVVDRLAPAIINAAFLQDIQKNLQDHQINLDGFARLCHGFGKNYRDLWRLRNGLVERAPDAVVFPQSHREVEHIMNAATKHNVCLIPFGGGTNVVGAVEVDPRENQRMVVSVDMRRMNRLLSVDTQSKTAVFECGVLGPQLDGQLAPHGLCLGHDPDSYVHSTLGGWIATRSSGAASNRYGELEQMVVSLRVVTPQGTIITPATPRAIGPKLNEIFIGSEGALGIITEATVKVHPLPATKYYEGWLLPTFEASLAAAYEIVQSDDTPPILRCYDEEETTLSFSMKFEEGTLKDLLSKGIKHFLTAVKHFDLEKVSLVIVGYEGTRQQVTQQRHACSTHFKRHKGFNVGASAGNNWQLKKYDLPLIRDFCLEFGMWADVLETCVDYRRILPLWQDVRRSVHDTWRRQGKVGWIGAHMCHQYRVGACIYFTFASVGKDKNDIQRLLEIKTAATEAIIRNGGALTHHHGVGYEHVPWMQRHLGDNGLRLLQRLKSSIDPQGICNPSKLLPPEINDPKLSKEERERLLRERMMFHRMGVSSKL